MPVAYSIILRGGLELRFMVHNGKVESWIDRDGKAYQFTALTLIEPDKESAFKRGEYGFSHELNEKMLGLCDLQNESRVGIVIDQQDGKSIRYWAENIVVIWSPDKPRGKFSFRCDLDPTPEPFIYD